MIKETVIESVKLKSKAEKILLWYKEVEKKIKGTKKYRIRQNAVTKMYEVLVRD